MSDDDEDQVEGGMTEAFLELAYKALAAIPTSVTVGDDALSLYEAKLKYVEKCLEAGQLAYDVEYSPVQFIIESGDD